MIKLGLFAAFGIATAAMLPAAANAGLNLGNGTMLNGVMLNGQPLQNGAGDVHALKAVRFTLPDGSELTFH
jgi:hypothetical protein